MEVHYHPHHLGHKKKWKEYLLEFLMIFLAVTLGFVAENIRENISEHYHEKELMRSMLDDLKADSVNIKSEMVFCNTIISGLDSLSNALFMDTRDVPEVYRLNAMYGRLVRVPFSDRTSSQLKSGGMAFIKKQKVANAISGYWSGIEAVEYPQENFRVLLRSTGELSFSIFNKKYIQKFSVDSVSSHSIVKYSPDAKFLTSDETMLINYGNRIRSLQAILSNFYLRNLNNQFINCQELTSLIKKEYPL